MRESSLTSRLRSAGQRGSAGRTVDKRLSLTSLERYEHAAFCNRTAQTTAFGGDEAENQLSRGPAPRVDTRGRSRKKMARKRVPKCRHSAQIPRFGIFERCARYHQWRTYVRPSRCTENLPRRPFGPVAVRRPSTRSAALAVAQVGPRPPREHAGRGPTTTRTPAARWHFAINMFTSG